MQKARGPEWDWLSAFLLFLLLQVAAARLVTTDWAPFLYFVETLSSLGIILGLALGASRFSKQAVAALTVGYTSVVLPWQFTAAATEGDFATRLTHVGGIMLVSSTEFFQRRPVENPLFFVVFVCLVFWLISLAAGYWLTRYGGILASIVLGGAAIILVQAYADYQARGSWWLAVYLLVSLLLAGRIYFLRSRREWSRRRVFINEESWSNILGSLFTTASIAILIAWLIPTSPASLKSATDTWNTISRPIRERLSNAVTSLNGPYGKAGTNFYGTTLALGQKAATGDSVMFTARVLRASAAPLRYYWRGRVYNEYSEGSWSISSASSLPFQPTEGDLKIDDPGGRSEVQVQFTSQFPTQSLLYAPSPSVWVDRPANVTVVTTGAGQYDALSWVAGSPVRMDGSYEVRAEISNPTVEQLRGAGATYPAWVSANYLQVPTAFQEDLKTLAQEASVGQDNPYDKATAITNYLRAYLQYSASVPAPPDGQDPTMWVLFDYRQGFCNYYASAEVLLLRSIGIPARLAVGFAHGEVQDDAFVIRRRDAHAWPEAYFPGIGWVEFEPTVIQDPLVRPSAGLVGNGVPSGPSLARRGEGEEGAGPQDAGSSAAVKPLPFSQSLVGQVLIVLAPLLAVAILVILFRRYQMFQRLPVYLSRALEGGGVPAPVWLQRWARWNQLEAVERSFASINWSLRWLGNAQPVHATPAERARVLSRILPAASRQIDVLRYELESGLFTPRPANMTRAWRASLSILFHAVRARLLPSTRSLQGRDVYSSPDHR